MSYQRYYHPRFDQDLRTYQNLRERIRKKIEQNGGVPHSWSSRKRVSNEIGGEQLYAHPPLATC